MLWFLLWVFLYINSYFFILHNIRFHVTYSLSFSVLNLTSNFFSFFFLLTHYLHCTQAYPKKNFFFFMQLQSKFNANNSSNIRISFGIGVNLSTVKTCGGSSRFPSPFGLYFLTWQQDCIILSFPWQISCDILCLLFSTNILKG